MKRVVKYLSLILILCFGITFKVNAAFQANTLSGLNYIDSPRWIDAGVTFRYNIAYAYRCTGSTTFTLMGTVGNPAWYCADGQNPTSRIVNNGCQANGQTCAINQQYFCVIEYDVTCPQRPTTQPPTEAPTQPYTERTKAPTTAKPRTTKAPTTQAPQTEATTEATTEIVTEPTTEAKKANAKIKSIKINKKSINYKQSKNEYKFKIAYGIDAVDVKVEPEDSTSKVEIKGNQGFDDEKETEDITITVTSEDETESTVVVIHANKYKPSETDCTLANIYVKDYNIDYDKNTFEYSLTLGKEIQTLDIETIKQYDGQIVDTKGNEKLKNKSKIVIEVESPSGDICTYTIQVKKNSSVWKYLIIILVLVIALGVAGYFLYNYINKSRGLYKYE